MTREHLHWPQGHQHRRTASGGIPEEKLRAQGGGRNPGDSIVEPHNVRAAVDVAVAPCRAIYGAARAGSALSTLLALAGCFGNYPAAYDCALVRSCGTRAWVAHVEWTGTQDEIADLAHGWATACRLITAIDVDEGRCPFVVCAALCDPEDAP